MTIAELSAFLRKYPQNNIIEFYEEDEDYILTGLTLNSIEEVIDADTIALRFRNNEL